MFPAQFQEHVPFLFFLTLPDLPGCSYKGEQRPDKAMPSLMTLFLYIVPFCFTRVRLYTREPWLC